MSARSDYRWSLAICLLALCALAGLAVTVRGLPLRGTVGKSIYYYTVTQSGNGELMTRSGMSTERGDREAVVSAVVTEAVLPGPLCVLRRFAREFKVDVHADRVDDAACVSAARARVEAFESATFAPGDDVVYVLSTEPRRWVRSGALIGSVLAAVLFVLYAAKSIVLYRRVKARSAQECVRCGYDRRGIAVGVKCPECGTVPAP